MKFQIMENTIDDIKKEIDKSNFKDLWLHAERGGLYLLCNEIRRKLGDEPYSYEKFDEGWQYRRVLADDFKEAKNEFLNLIFGWW